MPPQRWVTVTLLVGVTLVASACTAAALRGSAQSPETLVVQSGALRLRAILYEPLGPGPFPAVLFSHGGGHATGVGADGVPDQLHPDLLGPLFTRHGYAFFHLYRRGDGLSRDQGTAVGDELDRAATQSREARNQVQVERLQHEDLSDALAGLAVLRARPEIEATRVAVVGHSFGGSLTVLLAARDSTLGAGVVFSGGGYSYDRSPELRQLLLDAVRRARMPLFFIHARNDYSTSTGESLGVAMARLGKPHRVKIYPPVGHTAAAGHNFIYSGVSVWEPDVFAFLDRLMKR